jgi:Tfp pilus assembly protein PilV
VEVKKGREGGRGNSSTEVLISMSIVSMAMVGTSAIIILLKVFATEASTLERTKEQLSFSNLRISI